MAQTLGELVGSCIRRRRQELGLTQVEFAERAGFYQTYLSRLERGKANPTLNALDVVSAALGTTIFELFDEVERETRKPRAAKRAAASRQEARGGTRR